MYFAHLGLMWSEKRTGVACCGTSVVPGMCTYTTRSMCANIQINVQMTEAQKKKKQEKKMCKTANLIGHQLIIMFKKSIFGSNKN